MTPSRKPKTYDHDYDLDNRIDVYAIELERKLSEAVYQRTTIDARFIRDLKSYNGQYDDETADALKNKKRSRVFMNLTRAKTDAGESQLVDLLFPLDDKNWGIEPTPKPELVSKISDDTPVEVNGTQFQYEDTGEPVVQGDIALRELEDAKERCAKMETEIEDQLVQADYATKGRLVIHDACTLGTGILKAPVVTGRINRRYQETKGSGEFRKVSEQKFVPSVEVVRPWDFFPDPSAAVIEECEYTFERRFMSRKQIRNLVKVKGFDKEQIRKVLGMKAKATQHQTSFVDDVRVVAGLNDQLNDTRYELWEYHGEIPKEVLVDFGYELTEEEMEDPLLEMTGIVHYCGGVVLGIKVHLIDYDKSFPYRVFNWIPDDSNIFGFGIPHICYDQQDVINSSIRMMLDNAAITAGPQLGVNRKRVSPMDGDWTMTPFKFWDLKDNIQDIKQAFTSVEFNSHLPELQSIYGLARVLLDEVSGVPMLQQGEQGQSTPTLGGMSMLMNAANTVRRRQVKLWDDCVTKPMLRDFYQFNMEFSKDETIKGDYEVYARGTSALLVKEQIAQSIANFLGVVGASEAFSPVLQMKAREILEAWAKTQSLPKSLIPTADEFNDYIKRQQESQGQQQDPQTAVEEMRMEQIRQKQEHDKAMQENDKKFEHEQRNLDRQIKMQQLQEQREYRISQEKQEMMRLAQQDKINQDRLFVELDKLQTKLEAEWRGKELEEKLKARFGETGNYGIE